MKELVAGRQRVEPWHNAQNRIRAVHDNLGFTLICLSSPSAIGSIIRACRAVRRKRDKTENLDRTAILHAKVLREVTVEEVRANLVGYKRKNCRLAVGWWYEVIAD